MGATGSLLAEVAGIAASDVVIADGQAEAIMRAGIEATTAAVAAGADQRTCLLTGAHGNARAAVAAGTEIPEAAAMTLHNVHGNMMVAAHAPGALSDAAFADDKVSMAKQILRTNCIVIEQLVEILEEISFDEDQLNLAKFAYDHVYDLENYYEVYGVFSFSSSSDELDDFIESQH